MADFRRQHPEIALRIVAQDELDEIKPNGADLLIRYGPGSWEEPTAIKLFNARVVAMASPDYLARHPIRNIDDVTTAALIAYDTPGREWVSWSDWARVALRGRALPTPALSVSRYHDAVIAAQQGHGIVLVWNVLDRAGLGVEGLVPIPGPEIRSPGAFYLVPLTAEKEATRSLIDWFNGQSVIEKNAGS
ncbi:Transcriptional regulator (plasmid) [Rhizobium freirei PRF 81]|uniref:Transcriptional regulator n=2 Tax=Rhizobium freirei TaxID=1353277 RepID=N6USW5_9HYPH|nr:Transcriptional regulator [Rhizobium freirei PRF 81]